MPTYSRVLIDNVIYRVITRGNQRQVVFTHDSDFEQYINTIWKYKKKFKIKLYAYCLMDNHVHLVIEPSDKDLLKKFMHCLNLSYSKWFNCKYGKCGHLWQGRFKSFVVQKDKYLINCITYVEFNPLRANLCQRAEDYPWSSYNSRILGKPDKIVDDLIM